MQMGGQKWFLRGLKGIYLPVHLTDWLPVLVEVALVLMVSNKSRRQNPVLPTRL